jgi:glycosyltransferase involved in cell wall biosynthesis
MTKKTLIYTYGNPESGGIPRYTYELVNKVESEKISVDKQGYETIFMRVLNSFFLKKYRFYSQKNKLSQINHFLQPEIFTKTRGKDIVTFHDLYELDKTSFNSLIEKIRGLLFSKRVEYAVKEADYFIAVSKQTADKLKEKGVSDEQIKVVNLGVDKKFGINKSKDERKNAIGYIGDASERKRVNKLLKDFKDSGIDYDLLMAGSVGNQIDVVARNTEVLGRVPEEELVDFYNSIKALFIPSIKEGFGLPILEAAKCGTPVFIYEDTEVSEEVEEYCIRVESVSDVKKYIEEIEQEDLNRRSEKISKEFSWQKTIEETKQVYREVYDL